MQGLKRCFLKAELFNFSTVFLECCVTRESLQKTRDASPVVKDVHLPRVCIEKQWESSAGEWKNVFHVKSPLLTSGLLVCM